MLTREVEFVEATGGLEALAEATDEVVGNEGISDVQEDVALEGDWR